MVWEKSEKVTESRQVALILLLGLTIRVLYLYIYQSLPDWELLITDNNYHHHWAQVIADGNVLGDTTYFRAPLYIWLLAAMYKLFTASLWVGRLLGLVIGISSVYLTYLLARRLFNHRVALVAAVLHALYPDMIYFESELLLDPLFTLLVQLAILQLLRWWEIQSLAGAMGTGVLLGLAASTRPTALVFLPLVAMMMIHRSGARRWIKPVLLVGVGTALIVLPITIRNIVIAGDPVLIASQGGINLYIGNNDAADGVSAVLPEPLGHNWQIADIEHIAYVDEGFRLSSGEVSSYWTRRAWRWIKAHPAEFVSLYLHKVYYQFTSARISNNRNLPDFFNRVWLLRYIPLSFGIILFFAVVGAMVSYQNNKALRYILGLMALYITVTALFFFNTRFRLPLLPFYFLLAAAGLTALPRLWKNKRRLLWPGIVAVLAGIVSFVPLVSFPTTSPAQLYLTRGTDAYARGAYRNALSFYREAARVEESFPEVYLNMGAAYFRLGITDSARICFEKEIAAHPGRAKGYSNMASLQLVTGRADSALALARQALTLRPYDINATIIATRALGQMESVPESAIETFTNRAIDNTSRHVKVVNEVAALYLSRGKLKAAKRVFIEATGTTPPAVETDDTAFDRDFANSPANWRKMKAQSYYSLGYIDGLSGNPSGSINYLRQALTLNSSLAEAWVNLAAAYRAVGQPAQADSIIQEAITAVGETHLRQLLQQ